MWKRQTLIMKTGFSKIAFKDGKFFAKLHKKII